MKTKKKKTKLCEVCSKEIPVAKFDKHIFWLYGIRATLCRGMPKPLRIFFEDQSKKRMRKIKAKGRSLGYEGRILEAFIRGSGFGFEDLPK